MAANTQDRSIWRHADFRRLWMARTISEIGSQISFLALPLVATIILDASPLQMGILTAASSLPSLLLGLHTGALVDRRSKRPLLLAADIGRALLLLIIPLAWLFHMLSIELLFAGAFLGGFLTLVFHVAYQTFLLTILDRRRIVDGNSKLELSRTAAEIVTDCDRVRRQFLRALRDLHSRHPHAGVRSRHCLSTASPSAGNWRWNACGPGRCADADDRWQQWPA